MACYKGQRYATGTCVPCRLVNAIRHRRTNTRYRGTVLGILADARHDVRHHAQERGKG